MYTIKLMNEYLHGALWVYEDDGMPSYYDLIDEDEHLQIINNQIMELFSSYYEFDSHDMPCWFNKEQEKADKYKMLELLKQLNDRLNEINDGSFVVEDLETERVKNL